MSEPHLKKRKKSKYFMVKKKSQYSLEPGLKGFLCTCNFREKDCIKEAYNILNLYADQLEPGTGSAENDVKNEGTKERTESDDSDSDDIGDSLTREINAFLNEKPTKKRFQVVESGAKNVVFIRTTVENPSNIVSAVMHDILTKKEQKSRFLLRLLPIEKTCKANMEDIKKVVTKLIDEHFSDKPTTFAVVFNQRNSNKLTRDAVNNEIANIIRTKNSAYTVDLRKPDLTIIVEVIRWVCLLSIVSDYYKFKKYNLLQLFESVTKSCDESSKANENDIGKTEQSDDNVENDVIITDKSDEDVENNIVTTEKSAENIENK